jgi:hypothetical protein
MWVGQLRGEPTALIPSTTDRAEPRWPTPIMGPHPPEHPPEHPANVPSRVHISVPHCAASVRHCWQSLGNSEQHREMVVPGARWRRVLLASPRIGQRSLLSRVSPPCSTLLNLGVVKERAGQLFNQLFKRLRLERTIFNKPEQRTQRTTRREPHTSSTTHSLVVGMVGMMLK